MTYYQLLLLIFMVLFFVLGIMNACLVDKIRKLRKERDWLAQFLVYRKACTYQDTGKCNIEKDCVTCWIKTARSTVDDE